MRSMPQSRYPRMGLPEAPLPLQPANEIDACNGDLIVAIAKIIVGNMILAENHLISSEDLLD
jgi:hypothetical protein